MVESPISKAICSGGKGCSGFGPLGTLGLPESSLQAAKARVMVMAKVERLSKVIVMSKKSFGAYTENVKRHLTSDVLTLWH